MTSTTVQPSAYWQFLDRNRRPVDFDNFKRTVNHNYFDWRWTMFSLRFNPLSYLRWLWQNTAPRDKWRARSTSLQVTVAKLLWLYAIRHDRLLASELTEPSIGNPYPAFIDGRLVSQDLANSILEANFICAHSTEPKRVIEIGAGYGRTAYVLLSLFPQLEYVIIDIPPALDIARRYLRMLFPDRSVCFLTPDDAEHLIADGWATHGISISTLPEFTSEQVAEYLGFLNSTCQHVYLKQWTQWHNEHDESHWIFHDFSLPGWTEIAKQTCPYAVEFTEAIYRV